MRGGKHLIPALLWLGVALPGVALPGVARAASDQETVSGWWLNQDGRAAIRIAACGDKLCGWIEWLKEPNDPKTGQPKTDHENPDPSLRSRAVCGLPLMYGFVPDDDPGEWTEGRVYDPDSGSTYHAHLALLPDGKLKLRGYIGIPLLGRTEIWSRPATQPVPCRAG